MNSFFLSCKKATELIEKRNYDSISILESIKLWFHKLACTACTLYEKQSKSIDELLDKNNSITHKDSTHKLSDDKKRAILEKIKESQK